MFVDDEWGFSAVDRGFRVSCLGDWHVTPDYVSWLNGYEDRRFLDSSEDATIESQKEYVSEIRGSPDRLLLGLFSDCQTLIGTTGLHQVGVVDAKTTYMGILIGHPRYRGIGLGSVWVWVGASILFNSFNARKVSAGSLSANRSSIRSFTKAGFAVEQTTKFSKYIEGFGWVDSVVMGCDRGNLVAPADLGIVKFGLQ